MATEVLDVIHRLTYQYNSDGLDRALKSVDGNAKAVDALSIKLRRLEADYTQTANIIERKNISRQIEKTKAAIAGHNAAIEKTIQNSKPLRDAIEKEAGLIGQLESKLRTLKDARTKATNVADVRRYTKEIQDAQKELNALTSPGGKGIFSRFGANFLQGLSLGGGIGLATAAGSALRDFVSESSQLAKEAEGVERAFSKLNRPDLLDNLRRATRGTVSDLELMKQAVQFNNFQLPVEKLGVLLDFARGRARDTGQEVGKIVNDLTSGIARQSTRILDNLGIAPKRIRDEFKKTGDFAQAAFNIIDEEAKKSAATLDGYADKADRAAAAWENVKRKTGGFFNNIKEYGLDTLDYLVSSETERIVKQAEGLIDEARAKELADQKEAHDFLEREYARYMDNYLKATKEGRAAVLDQVRLFEDRVRAAEQESMSRGLTAATAYYRGLLSMLTRFRNEAAAGTAGPKTPGQMNVEELEAVIKRNREFIEAYSSDDLKDATKRAERDRLLAENKDAQERIDSITGVVKKARIKSHNSEYNLEKDLSKRINDLRYQQDLIRLKDEAQTTEKIRKEIDLRIEKDNEELDIQIENARKRKVLTQQAAADFETIRGLLKENAELEFSNRNEELMRGYKSRSAGYRIDAYKYDLDSYRSRTGILGAGSLYNTRDQIARERQIAIEEENKRFDDLKEVYRKEGRKIEDIQMEHNDRLELINLQFFQKDAQAHLSYLEDLKKQADDFAAREIAGIDAAAAGEIEGVRDARNGGGITKSRYARLRALIELRRQVRAAQIGVDKAGANYKSADEAQRSIGEALQNPELSAARRGVLQREFEKAKQAADEAQALLTQAKDGLDEANNAVLSAGQKKLLQGIDIYQALSYAAVDAYNQISAAAQRSNEREITVRERRVTEAQRLAERGNVEALRLESERLDKAQRMQEEYARRQQAINSGLAASNALVAVARTAAESGVTAPVLIPVVLSAIIAGIAAVQSMGFAEGGYTGHGSKYEPAGVVHKGEVVFSQRDVAAFGGWRQLEDFRKGLHSNAPVVPIMPTVSGNEFATRKELKEIGKKLDVVADAISSMDMGASFQIDREGVAAMVTNQQKRDRMRFR